MILETNHFWRDQDNLDIAISFNRYQCRIQNGTDDTLISFSVSTTTNAQVIKDNLAKIISQLEDYIDAH